MQVPRGATAAPPPRLSPQYQQQGVRAAQPWQPQVPAQSLRTAPRTNGGSYEPHPQSLRTVPRCAGGSYEPQPQSLRTSPRNAGAGNSYVPPPEPLRNTPRSAGGGGSYVPPEVRPNSYVPPAEVRPCSGTGSYVATPQSPCSPVLAGMARRALSPHGFPEHQAMQSSASLSSLPPAHDGPSQVPPRVAVPRGQGSSVSGHHTPVDRRGESVFPWTGAEATPAARAHSQGARSCVDLRNGSHSGPLPRTPHGSGSNSHARTARQESGRRDSARGDSVRADSARDSTRGGRDGSHSHGSGHGHGGLDGSRPHGGQGAAHGASTRAQSIGSCRSSSLLSLHDGGCPAIERRDAGDNVSHSNRPPSRNASATSGDRVRSPTQELSRSSRGSRLGAQTLGSTRLAAPSNRGGQSGRPHAVPVKAVVVHVAEIDCHPSPPMAQIAPSVTPTSSPPDTPGFADRPGHSSGPRSATATDLDSDCHKKVSSGGVGTVLVSSPQSEQRQTPERDAPRRAPRRTDHHGASEQLLAEIQEVRARLCEAKDKIVERDEHIERLREREAELNAELAKERVRQHGQRKSRSEHEVASAVALEKEAKVECKVAEMQARAQDLEVQKKDLASQRSELAKAKEQLAEHRRLLRQQQDDFDAQVDANHDKEGVLRERMMHLAEAERREKDDRRKIDETLASLKDREAEVRKQEQAIQAEVRKQEQAIRQRERALEVRESDAGSREADLEVLRERELNLKDQEERLRRWQKQLEEREQQHIEAVKEAEVLKLKLNPGSRRSPRAGKENQELKRQIEEQQTRMKEIKQVGWQQQVPE